MSYPFFLRFFFFNHTTTTQIYTFSLHDALPISSSNARAFDSQEIIRAPACLCARCLRDHHSRRPSETDRALRKKADECIPEQSPECRMHFPRRPFLPGRECYFHNRT